MILEFRYNYLLGLVYSNDLKHIFLSNTKLDFSYFSFCKDVLNGIIVEPKINELDHVTLSKQFHTSYNIETEPNDWRLILNLQNIEKLWKFSIYNVFVEKKEIKGLKKYNIDHLPNNCFPYLKWLIPLSLDSLVYKSNFNQILMN